MKANSMNGSSLKPLTPNPVVIGNATLYHGDCFELMYKLDHEAINSVVMDPPYGIKWNVDSKRFTGGNCSTWRGRADKKWKSGIVGDDKDFDITPWLGFKHVISWGANCYPTPKGTQLVWVKRNPSAFGSFLSDGEVAFMKGGHGVYCYSDVPCNGAGQNFRKHHPHEKPIDLMAWCVAKTKGVMLDPFMGSGTTGVACAKLGRPFIGIEIDREYFDVACERLRAAHAQKSFFDEPEFEEKLIQGEAF